MSGDTVAGCEGSTVSPCECSLAPDLGTVLPCSKFLKLVGLHGGNVNARGWAPNGQ